MKPWDRQTFPEQGKPYGWIQWKGTNVCLDFNCKCGANGHFDGDFAYNLTCGECGTTYMLNGHIELVELSKEEEKDAGITHVVTIDEDD